QQVIRPALQNRRQGGNRPPRSPRRNPLAQVARNRHTVEDLLPQSRPSARGTRLEALFQDPDQEPSAGSPFQCPREQPFPVVVTDQLREPRDEVRQLFRPRLAPLLGGG